MVQTFSVGKKGKTLCYFNYCKSLHYTFFIQYFIEDCCGGGGGDGGRGLYPFKEIV